MSFSVPKMEGNGANDPLQQINAVICNVKQPLEAEITRLKEELQHKDKWLGKSRQEIIALNERVQDLNTNHVNQNLQRFQQENNVLQSKVLTLTAENSHLNAELQATQNELAEKSQQIQKTLHKCKTLENEKQVKVAALEEIIQNLEKERGSCNTIVRKLMLTLDPTVQPVPDSSCENNLIKFAQLLSTWLFFHGAGILEMHQGLASLVRNASESQVASEHPQLPTPCINTNILQSNYGTTATTSDNATNTQFSDGLGDLPEPLNQTTEEEREDERSVTMQPEENLLVTQSSNAPTTRRSGRLQKTLLERDQARATSKTPAKRKKLKKDNRHTKKIAKKVKLEMNETPQEALVQHKKDKSEAFRGMHFCICGKEFLTEVHLKYHLNYFLSKREIQCPRIVRKKRCQAVFRTSSALNQHCRQEHGSATSYVRCKLCDKLFLNQSKRLQHHRKMHQVDLTKEDTPEINPESPHVDVDAATDSDGESDMLSLWRS